jgi:hypothetical protein
MAASTARIAGVRTTDTVTGGPGKTTDVPVESTGKERRSGMPRAKQLLCHVAPRQLLVRLLVHAPCT